MKRLTMIVAASFMLLAQPCRAEEGTKTSDTLNMWKSGDYTVEIRMNAQKVSESQLNIKKAGQVVFEEEGIHYELVAPLSKDKTSLPIGSQDITGDGEMDLIVRHHSGGAHCCYSYKVFSLGNELRVLAELDLKDAGGRFQDLDGDGVFEITTNDMTFAYWNAPYSDSPAPEVVLRFKDGTYQVAYDLMKKPLPGEPGITNLCNETKKEGQADCTTENFGWKKDNMCVTPDIWGVMLYYIYSGNPAEAWKFLDGWWQGDAATKEMFVSDFKKQLALSPYASQFQGK